MAVGTVGGTLQRARRARGWRSESWGSDIGRRRWPWSSACVGLASNLAALRALATEGIQRGHMALHGRAVGRAATGAAPSPPSPR